MEKKLVDICSTKFWALMCNVALVSGAQACELKEELRKIAEPGWIPVSERLPEYGDRVLVQFSDGDICIYKFEQQDHEAPDHWLNDYGHMVGDVYSTIVWQPLPEPWEDTHE